MFENASTTGGKTQAPNQSADETLSAPLKPLHLARKPAFHRQRTFLHLFCDGDDASALFRQHEPVDRALKQHLTGLLFERFQPAAHGGLAELQGSGRAGQSACPRYRQKDPHVIPIHRAHQQN